MIQVSLCSDKFDLLPVIASLENSLNKDAGRVDLIGIEFPGGNEDLDFGNGDLPRGGHHVVEIIGGVPVDQVSGRVPFPGLHEGKIGAQRGLQNVRLAVKNPDFLVPLHLGAISRGDKKGWNSRPPCPDPFGERALRDEFDFQFAGDQLALEFFVFAHVGSDHFLQLAFFQQPAQPEVFDSGIVGDTGEVFDAEFFERSDGVFRNATQAESTQHQGHPVLNALQGFRGIFHCFLHRGVVLPGKNPLESN